MLVLALACWDVSNRSPARERGPGVQEETADGVVMLVRNVGNGGVECREAQEGRYINVSVQ